MNQASIFKKIFNWQTLVLLFMAVAALAMRVYDLTDAPFDFHPTRQYFTAIMARGEYYQSLTTAPQWRRDRAVNVWQAEEGDFPTIDALAVLTYRLIGHEDLFYPRLYSALFWLLGGVALYLLARALTSSSGALLALGVYWFTPYGIIASRAFQPDPLMTALTLFAWWAMWRWFQTREWKWAIIAGLFSGAAMLVKVLAAFTLLGGMAGVFFAQNLRKSLREIQFWVMGLLASLPVIGWTVYNLMARPNFSGQFGLRFFPQLWLDPIFWIRIEVMWERVIGLVPFMLALLGFFLITSKEKRIFIGGVWGGYFLFMFVFAYYFMTHDYYHIALVPIAALTLAPLADSLWTKLREQNPQRIVQAALILILLFGLSANLWNVRQTLHKADYRDRAAALIKIGELLGPNVSVAALTSDYAYPFFYYSWLVPSYWPETGDDALRALAGSSAPDFAQRFAEQTRGKEYFVVTDFTEYDAQPQLKQLLTTTYPVLYQEPGFIIYDLRAKK